MSKKVLWLPVCSLLGEMGPNCSLSGKGCRPLTCATSGESRYCTMLSLERLIQTKWKSTAINSQSVKIQPQEMTRERIPVTSTWKTISCFWGPSHCCPSCAHIVYFMNHKAAETWFTTVSQFYLTNQINIPEFWLINMLWLSGAFEQRAAWKSEMGAAWNG